MKKFRFPFGMSAKTYRFLMFVSYSLYLVVRVVLEMPLDSDYPLLLLV